VLAAECTVLYSVLGHYMWALWWTKQNWDLKFNSHEL
jgi:hypothetical protein